MDNNFCEFDIDKLIGNIEVSGKSIASSFEDWTKVAFAIASEYGENGRGYFYKIASMYSGFSIEENKKKYDNALRTGKKVSISSLVYMAKTAGIDVSDVYKKTPFYTDLSYVFNPQKYHTDELESNEIDKNCGIPDVFVSKSFCMCDNSNLYSFMENLFPNRKSHVISTFSMYKVGGTKNKHETIFWQIDKNGICRDGKIIQYGTDGHRIKTTGANWVHSLAKEKLPSDYIFKQCLFGENISSIIDTNRIFLVESEKTAIICSIFFDENVIWMATGGIGNLKTRLLKSLSKKYFIAFPDIDGMKSWKAKSDSIFEDGLNIKTYDWWKGKEGVSGKEDIADYLVKIIQSGDIQKQEDLKKELSKISIF